MINLYRYLVVGVFLLCLTFLVITVRGMQDDIDEMHFKVNTMETVNKIHFNTLLSINNDLDEVMASQKEMEKTIQEQEELIVQLERMQNLGN